MKNDHSSRLSRSPGIINTQGTNCTNSYFRGYVNQIILCRFYGVFQHTRPLFLYDNTIHAAKRSSGQNGQESPRVREVFKNDICPGSRERSGGIGAGCHGYREGSVRSCAVHIPRSISYDDAVREGHRDRHCVA
jgi:hypothetical protein